MTNGRPWLWADENYGVKQTSEWKMKVLRRKTRGGFVEVFLEGAAIDWNWTLRVLERSGRLMVIELGGVQVMGRLECEDRGSKQVCRRL